MSFRPRDTSVRLDRRLAELARFLYPVRRPIRAWEVRTTAPEDLPRGRSAAGLDALASGPPAEPRVDVPAEGAATLRVPAATAQSVWLRAHVDVPQDLDGRPVLVLLPTNAEGLCTSTARSGRGSTRTAPTCCSPSAARRAVRSGST